jgi:hypothetical protein
MDKKKEETAYMKGFMEGYLDGLEGKYKDSGLAELLGALFVGRSEEEIAQEKGYHKGWRKGYQERLGRSGKII